MPEPTDQDMSKRSRLRGRLTAPFSAAARWCKSRSPVRDALFAGFGAAAVFLIALWLPVWWARAALLIGVAVFVATLYFHRDFWYRRVVSFVVCMWAPAIGIPALKIEGQWGSETFGRLVADGGGWSVQLPLCVAFVASLIVCVYYETRIVRAVAGGKDEREEQPPVAPPASGTTASQNAQDAQQPVQIVGTQGNVDVQIITGDAAPPQPPPTEPLETEAIGPRWPEAEIKAGAQKVVEPFAGREEELGQICEALGGADSVIAIIGLAGQGKSSLIGEWWKRSDGLPEGVGLFWCRPYQAGYTFDRFLDEIYLYLTGERVDRQAMPTTTHRAEWLCQALRRKPCVVVLDGVERWLKRWAADPDAGPEGATVEDRAGAEQGLDLLFGDTAGWDNGSRLVMTTRALPSALIDSPHVTIGTGEVRDKSLHDLKPDEAVDLLKRLGVHGEANEMQAAVAAYGAHPYAVHILGLLLADLYGGEVAR